jgi:hypothetical protein
MMPRARFSSIPSPLKSATAAAWERLCCALEMQHLEEVSESGGLGMYDMRPRRLVELGYAHDLKTTRTAKGRQIHVCEFILPWTQTRFLSNPLAQRTALSQSMRVYEGEILSGKIVKPKDASISATLVILHRGGRGALKAWPEMFDETKALYERARGLF